MLCYFTKFSGLLGFEYKMVFAKFKEIGLELTGAENHASLVDPF